MSPFLVEVISYYRIHLSQLTPNVVLHIIGFEVLCRSQMRECTVGLFRHFFQIKLSQDWYSSSTRVKRPKILIGFRDSIKKWKMKYFFVKAVELGDWAGGMRWRESVKITNHIPAEIEYDEGSVGRISSDAECTGIVRAAVV